VHFPDLLAQVRAELGRGPGERVEEDTRELSGAMLQATIVGGLELHSHSLPYVIQPGEKPLASALARLQIEAGPRVSTVMHTVVQIDDALSRLLLKLLDGTRDRSELCKLLQAAVRSGEIENPSLSIENITERGLEKALNYLGRLGLLVG
jgi:hypothetical protein